MITTPTIAPKKLNIELIKKQLNVLKIRQADIANQLQVSRESVSKWLSNESFPKPKYLLQLGTFLNIDYHSLTLTTQKPLPEINFRKSGNNRMRADDQKEAITNARWLELLVKYIPVSDALHTEPLGHIDISYEFICSIADKIRSRCGFKGTEAANYKKLVRYLETELRTFVIPVLWGADNKNHGLHVYLPESKTHWIYVNLDCKAIDFVFYIAHELAHAVVPSHYKEDVEYFCDFLAGSIIFPDKALQATLDVILSTRTTSGKVAVIRTAAKYYSISPYTVYKQINKYIESMRKKGEPICDELDFSANLFKAMKFEGDDQRKATEILLSGNSDAKEYLDFMSEFGGKFYRLFTEFVKREDASPGVIQNILKTTLTDAQAIWEEFQKN